MTDREKLEQKAAKAADIADSAMNLCENRASRPRLSPLDRVAESLEWLAAEIRAQRLQDALVMLPTIELAEEPPNA